MDTHTLQHEQSKSLGRVAAKLFFAITDQWELNENQRLRLAGQSSRSTLHSWRKKVDAGQDLTLSPDTLERLSYLAGIYKALQIIFPTEEQWRSWVRKPNRDFGGDSALQHMLGGRVMDLADVRRYLDHWRGGAFE